MSKTYFRGNDKDPIISQLSQRKSIREFTSEKVKDEDLNLILKTVQRCPSSINGQKISLGHTKNKEKIKQIAKNITKKRFMKLLLGYIN